MIPLGTSISISLPQALFTFPFFSDGGDCFAGFGGGEVACDELHLLNDFGGGRLPSE
jgi:hypothetical protein